MRIINEDDIRAVLYGVSFLGAGGGGSLSDGLTILDDNIKKYGSINVKVIDADEIAEGGSAVVICGMGAPTVLKEKDEKFRYEAAYTFDAMTAAAQFAGKHIEAILPIEYGAVNYIVPMVAAIERDVPLVDADGCGRAVPGLDTTLFNINKIAFCPAAACDDKRNVVNLYLRDAADGKMAEEICRHMCGAFGYIMGLGGYLTSPKDIKEKLVTGTLSLAEKVGKVILDVKKYGGNIEEELSKIIHLRKLASGSVVKQETIMRESHDIGCTELLGDDGHSYFVDIKNESILFRRGNDVLLTCPDMLCAINNDTLDPLTNADINVGDKITYFAVPAPRIWFDAPDINALWKPYFEAVGYHGDIVPF